MVSPLNSAVISKPRLLFVSPTYPDTQGNGLAMRAGMFVEALSQRHTVTALVVPAFGTSTPSSLAHAGRYCDELVVVEPVAPQAGALASMRRRMRGMPDLVQLFEAQADACSAALGRDARFDVAHAFRLYTAPLALALAKRLPGKPRFHLDVDDIESVTRRRLAALYRDAGLPDAEAREEEASRQFSRAEKRLLPAFERVYACSEADAAALRPLAKGEVLVVPNAVRAPDTPPEPLTSHPFTFLFVGTLGYFPNEDAVRFFCTRVLPWLRARTRQAFRVRIAGAGLPQSLLAFGREPEVRLLGLVPDLATEYANADAVIVPVRGGGGTRIKVLEAFAYRRPVVSTTIGVEGIEAVAGEHYLRGDSVQAFGAQCLHLMEDATLRERVALRGRELVLARYSQETVNRLLASAP